MPELGTSSAIVRMRPGAWVSVVTQLDTHLVGGRDLTSDDS